METSKTQNSYSIGMSKGDRIMNPIRTPKQIVLFGTIGGGKTNLFIDDACGLAVAKGTVGTGSGTAFSLQGPFGVDNLKKFLQSYAVIVSRYNLDASVQSDLANNLEQIYTNLDGTQTNDFIFSSLSVSNMQFNAELLNISQGFVWTMNTALVLAGTAATVYTVTMAVAKVVPYGQLDAWLELNPMYKTL